jgi:hypothetical protein
MWLRSLMKDVTVSFKIEHIKEFDDPTNSGEKENELK